MKFLLIEDDVQTAEFIIKSLGEMGHVVEHFIDGMEGLKAGLVGDHDLILADRRLPSLDGLNIVKRLRAAGIETPLIFLTTMDGVDDRVEGLDAGGDDYLIKPFESYSYDNTPEISSFIRLTPCTGGFDSGLFLSA